MILTDHVIFVPNPIWRFFLRVTISKYVHVHSICVLVASIWKEEDCLHRFWISWLQVSILCRDGESKRRLSRWPVSELSLDSLAIVARLTYNRLTSDWQHSAIRRQPVDLDITGRPGHTGRLGHYRSTWTLPVDPPNIDSSVTFSRCSGKVHVNDCCIRVAIFGSDDFFKNTPWLSNGKKHMTCIRYTHSLSDASY